MFQQPFMQVCVSIQAIYYLVIEMQAVPTRQLCEHSKALNTLHNFGLFQMKDWHRETIVSITFQGLTLTPANPPNAGGFQLWRVTQSLPLATLAG